ncbi:DEAD/DEAH box helicase family protein [bacterium]|nr:DEAD/DEAH box helicase family protein [bacterium]
MVRLTLFVLLFAPSPLWARANFSLEHCGEAIAAMERLTGRKLSALPPKQEQFFSQHFLPAVGKRGFLAGPEAARELTPVDGGATLAGFGPGKEIHFRWQAGLRNPHFRMESNGNRTIFIPENFDFNSLPDRGQDFLMRALRGHPLQLFSKSDTAGRERDALKEPWLVEKEVQRFGIEAFNNAMDDGDDSFLFVGPTGVGKTIVLQSIMKRLIDDSAAKAAQAKNTKQPAPLIHVVFTDQSNLTGQLKGDLANIDSEYELFQWGDQKEKKGDPKTIDALIAHAQRTGRPIVLATTTRSLVLRTNGKSKDEHDYNLELLKEHLASLTMDEAHHSGAPMTANLIHELRGIDPETGTRKPGVKATDAKVVGFTATPSHSDMDIVDLIFHGNAFWGYLDTPESYRTQRGAIDRSFREILLQLETALARGESHPFKTHFLRPEWFNNTGTPLFTQKVRGKGRYQINPAHYANFFNGIEPYMRNNPHLFFACNTIEEARAFYHYVTVERPKLGLPPFLKPDGTPHTFGFMASGKDSTLQPGEDSNEDTKTKFEKGEISVLFNVDMMNEGINVPSLTAFIDTSRQTNVKDLVQRIGRIVRLAEGKIKISDVISFQEINDHTTAEALVALDELSRRDWGEVDENEDPVDSEKRRDEQKLVQDDPAPHDPTAAPTMEWDPRTLRAAERDFRSTADERRTAEEKFQRIGGHLLERDLDGFAQSNDRDRITHNLLADLIDRPSGVSIEFFERVALEPAVQARVKKFQKMRAQMTERMKTPQGTAEALSSFIADYKRVPEGGAKKTKDEIRLFNTIQRFAENGSAAFLSATMQRLSPENFRALGLDRHIHELTNTPVKILEVANRLYGESKRIPTAGTKGFEGLVGDRLEPAIKEMIEAHGYDEFETILIESVHHMPLLADILNTAEKYKPARVLPVANVPGGKPGKAEPVTPATRFRKVLISPERAKLNLPAPKKKVRMVIRGAKSTVPSLVRYYEQVATEMGFDFNPQEIPRGKDHVETVITIEGADGIYPSDIFAFETGNHRIGVKEGGQTYTNNVTVVVDGIGVPPKPGSPHIRKFNFRDQVRQMEVTTPTGTRTFEIGEDESGTQSQAYLSLLGINGF